MRPTCATGETTKTYEDSTMSCPCLVEIFITQPVQNQFHTRTLILSTWRDF
jgi:hypothetical protein